MTNNMKKYYFVKRGDFANAYTLVWSDRPALDGWERITRKEAVSLARAEAARREDDPSFSGYASAYITPAAWGEDDLARFAEFPQRYAIVDRIVEAR